MKEHYIRGKILDFVGKLRIQKKIDEAKLERSISRIEHMVTLELERSLKEVQRHMTDYIGQAVRKEML
ncbi:hypothetical protein UFOVP23_13 [uncultured Caudovirales phage]|uniref:Uncharacterized protein n=1 Tax=uncultured Caudovirales phage TaxID=2100421 RepID=A0A6J5T7N1_9CAUD|nr:hypothetical protein UFOVP23_13 [uncultured Caudovirales phage]